MYIVHMYYARQTVDFSITNGFVALYQVWNKRDEVETKILIGHVANYLIMQWSLFLAINDKLTKIKPLNLIYLDLKLQFVLIILITTEKSSIKVSFYVQCTKMQLITFQILTFKLF